MWMEMKTRINFFRWNGKFQVENLPLACGRRNATSLRSRIRTMGYSRTYVSHRSRVNNKCIPLTSYDFSISFSIFFFLVLFSVFSPPLCVNIVFASRSPARNRVKSTTTPSRAVLRLFNASITWKTWKTHSVRFHVSYEIGVALIEKKKKKKKHRSTSTRRPCFARTHA